MRSRQILRFAVTAGLAVIVAWGMLGDPPTDEERLATLAAQVACPVCENSVADSQATYARNIRAYISTKIADGQSNRQIIDGLVGSFGDEILLDPPARGAGLWLWATPIVTIVVGGYAVISLRRSDRANS